MYKTVTLWQFNYLLLRDYINKKIIICHRICMIIKFALPLRLKIYGVLAHLARARHWQCRGERFESAILHISPNHPPNLWHKNRISLG